MLIAFPLAAAAQSTTDARSPDYSDGIDHDHMPGMEMLDHATLGMLMIDQLEYANGDDGSGQRWEMQGWYGTDLDKLWLRSEGERSGGRTGDADLEAFWSHAVAAYWDTQVGVRHDFGEGPTRDWAAFGIQGLAPYFFETQATFYVGPSGRTAARLRTEYDVLFTQRLILQPELEVNFYGRADPARDIGSGLSDARFGLRLRYEVRRQFAPYVGVVWTRRFGQTADLVHAENVAVSDRQWVAGVRIWF
ncbi:MAG: copper resistance protein B [Proteobacteria bacterium]|nr:copper resistance protein B [Pseudomonadota bacterium]